jgi:DNA-binding NarL/FixJ family response regulator
MKENLVITKYIKIISTKRIMHNLNEGVHNNKFEIEERRREVASLLAQSMSETEIAQELEVDQFTGLLHHNIGNLEK